jgi:hypothetical protein
MIGKADKIDGNRNETNCFNQHLDAVITLQLP